MRRPPCVCDQTHVSGSDNRGDFFDPAWVGRFAQFETVYVALDPDATEQAFEIAALFERRGRVVFLPGKLDDLVKWGMTEADVLAFLMVAAPV